MLGKLLKYELKASARTLLPLYAGTLLIALICGVSMAVQTSNMNKFHQSMADGVAVTFSSFSNPVDGDLYTFIGFGMLLVSAFCVAVTVLTIISVVQRFNHGIAGNEGYLMFTLPVKHETLLASKLLGALLWSLASLLVFFLVGVLIGGPSLFVEREFFDWAFFWERVQELFRYYNPLPSMLLTAVNAVLSLVSVILTIYLSIMIGQMEQFNKYRVAVAVAAFFVIHWIFGLVESLLLGLPGINMMPEGAARVSDLYNGYYFIVGSDCLFTAALCVLCFFGTAWMMKKKLNL